MSESPSSARPMLAIMAFAAGVPFAVLLAVLTLLFPTEIYDFVKAFQTLISALVGFGGLIAVTLLGFRNTIRARHAEADLEHKRDDRLRENDARSFAAALRAEMTANAEHLERVTGGLMAMVDGNKDTSKTVPPPDEETVNFMKPKFPVFYGNLNRLGILGEDIDQIVVLSVSLTESRMAKAVLMAQASGGNPADIADGIPQLALFLRTTADKLRVRAGLPDDENLSEIVKRAEIFGDELEDR